MAVESTDPHPILHLEEVPNPMFAGGSICTVANLMGMGDPVTLGTLHWGGI